MANPVIKSPPNIVTIGGGTGHFTLLQELKRLTPNITAIVNMSDDGGSSGSLRDELGVLPPGDVRQCLVALSDSPALRDVFDYRFSQGSLSGQSLGNVILSGLELKYGSFDQAVAAAGSILRITGRVVPVTLDRHTLVLHAGSETVRGEHVIDEFDTKSSRQAQVVLDPPARLHSRAAEALAEADIIVIAPGSLYGSLLSALAVTGMPAALQASQAKKVLISNLVNKPGQTDGWHVVDYVQAIEHCIGQGTLDFVLYNNELPPAKLLQWYAADGELPVDFSTGRMSEIKAVAIGLPLVDLRPRVPDANDVLIRRTLIRHNAEKVSRQLQKLLNAEKVLF